MDEKIELTPQELDNIKDTIKFRECVMIKLKQLNNIPIKVSKLETKVFLLMWAIPVILGIFGVVKAVAR
jgi:hypothetical protein